MNIGKKVLGFVFTLALICSVALPSMEVKATDIFDENYVETRYILGDGVRLRAQGYPGGTILELMYNQEQIDFYPNKYGSDPEYNYMRRLQTGTYGYVDHHYAKYAESFN